MEGYQVIPGCQAHQRVTQWGVTVGEVDRIDLILQQLGKVAPSSGCLVHSGVRNGKREDLEATDIQVA